MSSTNIISIIVDCTLLGLVAALLVLARRKERARRVETTVVWLTVLVFGLAALVTWQLFGDFRSGAVGNVEGPRWFTPLRLVTSPILLFGLAAWYCYRRAPKRVTVIGVHLALVLCGLGILTNAVALTMLFIESR